jgi:hypothetical protein
MRLLLVEWVRKAPPWISSLAEEAFDKLLISRSVILRSNIAEPPNVKILMVFWVGLEGFNTWPVKPCELIGVSSTVEFGGAWKPSSDNRGLSNSLYNIGTTMHSPRTKETTIEHDRRSIFVLNTDFFLRFFIN